MEKMEQKLLISDELKELLQSFHLPIPEDAPGKSFVRDILNKDLVRQFDSDIRCLSRGVVLTKDLTPKQKAFNILEFMPSVVCVLEVNIDSGPGIWEEKTDDLMQVLRLMRIENLEKMILVYSDSVGIIDAKLRVYKKYHEYIDASGILLHHAHEDYDEINKAIAYKRVSRLYYFVGAMIESFHKESLLRIIDDGIDASLTPDNISTLCYEVSIRYKLDFVGTVHTGTYSCYSTFTVRAIKQILVEETLMKTAKLLGSKICSGILQNIESVVQITLLHELGNLRYHISDDIYHQIENTLIGAIIAVLSTLSGLIVDVVTFIIRIFHPVDVNSKQWRGKVAEEIYQKLFQRRQEIAACALQAIQNICEQTTADLEVIQDRLKEFRRKISPTDQKQLINEWLKREVIHDATALEKHPSILKYMAGRRIDGQPVVKVFLRDDHDKDAQVAFKKACQSLEFAKLEFVNIAEKSKEVQEKAKEIKLRERKAPPLDKTTRNDLKRVIQEHGEKIYATYSTVVGMRIGKVRCVGDQIEDSPCIVLYCLDKTLIPFGEKSLPKTIEGWHCDIREDYVMFGTCPNRCPASRQNLPDPGCSIGIPSVDSSGSVGFLVEPKNPTEQFRCGFLTASHVAVKRFKELNHYKSLLSMNHLSLEEHLIVHPSWQDNGHVDNTIGEVVESFCGNYGLCKTGLDFALVRSREYRKEEKEALPIVSEDDLTFDGEIKVTKSGRTTRTTIGDLADDSLTVRVDTSFLSKGYIAFFNCYAVENIPGNGDFFMQGDSGSGVFVIEEDKTLKPLGIAFASLFSQTAVCKIDTIVQKLDLKIVRYLEDQRKQLQFSETGIITVPEEREKSEPMDCT